MRDPTPETEIATSEARQQFSELVNRSAYGHERIALTRRGKRIAAVVPIEDLQLLEALDQRPELKASLVKME